MEKQNNAIKVFSMENDEFFKIFLRDTLVVYSSRQVLITSAETAEDALSILIGALPEVPNIIFLCLSIPTRPGEKTDLLGGFKVLENLRKAEGFEKVPIVIFSKYDDKKLQKKAKLLGATKYLVKGECMPKDLADVVEISGK